MAAAYGNSMKMKSFFNFILDSSGEYPPHFLKDPSVMARLELLFKS